MVTIKLKKPVAPAPARQPVRGGAGGAKARPTLAQAQAQRAEREALYQEQLRQRFGDKPPPFARRDEPPPRARRDGPPSSARRDGPPPFDRRDGPPPLGRRSGPPPLAGRDGLPQSPRRDDRDASRPPARASRDAPAQRGAAAPPRRDERQPPERGQRPPPRPIAPAAPPQALRRPFDRGGPAPRRDRDDDDDDDFVHTEHAPGSMRLSKRMSELGIASRREADEWIAKGWVRVDDQVVSELGSRVLPGQRVTVDAKAKYQQAQKVTVLVNKPVGYVSGQAEDGYEPALVLVTPDNLWREDRSGTRFLREHLKSLVPAGRLDIDSVGSWC